MSDMISIAIPTKIVYNKRILKLSGCEFYYEKLIGDGKKTERRKKSDRCGIYSSFKYRYI